VRPLPLAGLSLIAAVIVACSGARAMATPAASDRSSAGGAIELTILAAASLKGVLEEVDAAYEAANPGTTLTISTDSSAALATQIEQGAPADVFLSADTRNPQALVDKGLAAGDPVTFAGNKLTVIAPTDDKVAITTPADLAKPGIKVIAAGDEVPITRYATQLVDNLAREPGYHADFAAAYAANIASREDNVKAVVAKIELGEGDAGIVYVTDATASDGVTTIDVPDTADVPATYDGVVVKASRNAAAAARLLDWLAGPEGGAILARAGFLPPS
jgi:molybdate transport system substrate-binding protein